MRACARAVLPKDARYRLHMRLMEAPTRDAYLRLRPHLRRLDVRPDTDLVIEGYPRTANSYSVAAMEVSNGPNLRLAHHLHSRVSVLQAVKLGIPTLLLIRGPEDAGTSWMQKAGLRAQTVLEQYVQFYEPLVSVAGQVVVGRFEIVVDDFGSLIERVNEFYGLSLKPYVGNAAEEDEVVRIVRNRHVAQYGRHDPLAVALPTPEKEAQAAGLRQQIRACPSLLRRANDVHRRITELASS
jgi:hypothetical protein